MEMRIISDNFWVNNLKSNLTDIKLSFYYRMWKTRIYKHGGISKYSKIKILDVGCGYGYFLKCLERWLLNAEIYGIDIDEQRLTLASQRLSRTKLIRQDAHTLLFSDKYFDVVTALQLLEHLEKPEEFLMEANRILKNNGLLIIATPNPSGIAARLLKEKWHGYNSEHISLKNPQNWRLLLQDLSIYWKTEQPG
ncbi:MAG: class I SAM-dependent methyltransferase [bacterium]|nr:class I SAM-dependent methyltransferase [bacterium]